MVSPVLPFLGSFFLTTTVVFLTARTVVTSLQSAGFHFTDIILVGLPKDINHPEMGNLEFQEYIEPLQQYVRTLTLSSPQVLAAAGAVLVTLLYLTVFGSSCKSNILLCIASWH